MCIAWNPVEPLEFVCSGMYSPLRVWRVIEDEDEEVDVRLKWGLVNRLEATDAEITDAVGLDDMQRKLLQQGGADDNAVMDTDEEDEVDENWSFRCWWY